MTPPHWPWPVTAVFDCIWWLLLAGYVVPSLNRRSRAQQLVMVFAFGVSVALTVYAVAPHVITGHIAPKDILDTIDAGMSAWAGWRAWKAGRPPRQRRRSRVLERIRVRGGRLVAAPIPAGGDH